MTSISLILLAILSARLSASKLCNAGAKSKLSSEKLHLNFVERTSIYQCSSEEHTVTTKDGYILTVYRMRGCDCCKSIHKTPIVVFHGLLLSSDSWLDAGPESGLPYLLSRSCYDVWIGNVRGTNHGRKHISLNNTGREFWDFYADEIGRYDLPATIDYVTNVTGTKIIHYIGYSQGGTAFVIMCSERPEYKPKIGLSILLAPASRGKHTKSEAFKTLTISIKELEMFLYGSEIYEIMTKDGFGKTVGNICRNAVAAETICVGALGVLDTYHSDSMSSSTLSLMFQHFPTGTSVRNMVWYGQNLMEGSFKKFDYGERENLHTYGKKRPPDYNISSVNVPTVIIYGKSDFLVDTRDVKWLADQLPNLVECVQVNDPHWNHLDFAYSRHVKEEIFPTINNFLHQYDKGHIIFNNISRD